jgi:hypothetical protein
MTIEDGIIDPAMRARAMYNWLIGEFRIGRIAEAALRRSLERLGFSKSRVDAEIDYVKGWPT